MLPIVTVFNEIAYLHQIMNYNHLFLSPKKYLQLEISFQTQLPYSLLEWTERYQLAHMGSYTQMAANSLTVRTGNYTSASKVAKDSMNISISFIISTDALMLTVNECFV